MLRELADAGRFAPFLCHFYNFYFAHTVTSRPHAPARTSRRAPPAPCSPRPPTMPQAGGRQIGKVMANLLIDGKTLNFYQWPAGSVDNKLLPELRGKIDALADTWTEEQRQACLDETASSFRYAGAMLGSLSHA